MSSLLTSNIFAMRALTITLDPAAVSSTNTTSEQTLTVPGLKVGDIVLVSKPTLTAGVGIVNVRVSAANTLATTWVNATGGSVNPGSETYTLLVFRPERAGTNAFM